MDQVSVHVRFNCGEPWVTGGQEQHSPSRCENGTEPRRGPGCRQSQSQDLSSHLSHLLESEELVPGAVRRATWLALHHGCSRGAGDPGPGGHRLPHLLESLFPGGPALSLPCGGQRSRHWHGGSSQWAWAAIRVHGGQRGSGAPPKSAPGGSCYLQSGGEHSGILPSNTINTRI